MDRRWLTAIVVALAVIGALSVLSVVISALRWLIIVALVGIGVVVVFSALRGPPRDPDGRW